MMRLSFQRLCREYGCAPGARVSHRRAWRAIPVLALLATIQAGAQAFQADSTGIPGSRSYSAVSLGPTLPDAAATAINDSGTVLVSEPGWPAFYLWSDGRLRRIQKPGTIFWGRCLAEDGSVGGWWWQHHRMGALLVSRGRIRQLNLPFGFTAVNRRGQWVGVRPVLGGSLFDPGDSSTNVFLYQPPSARGILGSRELKRMGLLVRVSWYFPTAINRSGQIVGYAYEQRALGGSLYVGFVWHQGHYRLLDPGAGKSGHQLWDGRPHAINDHGIVVGDRESRASAGGKSHACVWNGSQVRDLGTLGGPESSATDVNDKGEIVGWAETRSGEHRAFVFRNGKMTDLNALITPAGQVTLTEAVGINIRGEIIANAQTGVHRSRAFLLIPTALQLARKRRTCL